MNKPSETIREQMLAFRCPRWEEFPQVELYMDQLIEYINTVLEPLSLNDESAFVTKSMVNNYVKSALLLPPVKKRYSQKHVGYLLVICLLKLCYPLHEIGELIDIYRNLPDKQIELHYDRFATIFEKSLHEIFAADQLTYQLYEEPTVQQQLMNTGIRALTCRLYSEYLLQRCREQTA